jgi:hypothetical protein
MTNLPQNVSSRYTRNLLNNGSNSDFTLLNLSRAHSMVDELVVGYYYRVTIIGTNLKPIESVGATPTQAVQTCLRKHGVTFR